MFVVAYKSSRIEFILTVSEDAKKVNYVSHEAPFKNCTIMCTIDTFLAFCFSMLT